MAENDYICLVLNGSNMFQLWYQNICCVALAAGPTLEFMFCPKHAQMPQLITMMMQI